LRIKARDHIESEEAFMLAVAPRPDKAHEWQVRQQIFAEMRNEVNTFGLIKAGDLGGGESGENTSDKDWDY
jgi:hypothetical protein